MSRSRREQDNAGSPALDYAAPDIRVVAKRETIHPFDALATVGCIYLGLVTFGFAAFRYFAVLPAGRRGIRIVHSSRA